MPLFGTVAGRSAAKATPGLPVGTRDELVGLPETLQALAAIGDNALLALGEALEREARDLMRDSAIEVPLDKGPLLESGFVGPAVASGSTVEIECGYRGQPYALRQHEELMWHHPNQRKAKFLEDPFRSRATDMDERLAAHLRGEGGLGE